MVGWILVAERHLGLRDLIEVERAGFDGDVEDPELPDRDREDVPLTLQIAGGERVMLVPVVDDITIDEVGLALIIAEPCVEFSDVICRGKMEAVPGIRPVVNRYIDTIDREVSEVRVHPDSKVKLPVEGIIQVDVESIVAPLDAWNGRDVRQGA